MFGSLKLMQLQELWWLITSVVGSLFLFLTFVQGGQSLLFSVGKSDLERRMMMNSLGRKWELTFTTLVLFGGALFAAFPLFYATSFGGAYWVWLLILFTFIIQAVSYEYHHKPHNFLGAKTYEIFLFINGTVGVLLIGAAVGTFFTGSNFTLNAYNQVTWAHPWRGLEAALSPFNLSFGLFLVFVARLLGALYLLNNINFNHPKVSAMEDRLREQTLFSLLASLPFLLFILYSFVTRPGFALNPASGAIFMETGKYWHNLLAMPVVLAMLLGGLILVIMGVVNARFLGKNSGIWLAGPGTVLVGLAVFFTAAYNHTPFYPSKFDLQSSLTIYNASSSHYTLTVMSYVALGVPFVLAYIVYFWYLMDARKLSADELLTNSAKEIY